MENLGLANARDIIKMLRWNDKYGIKFMRLSSEMFPFASHDEYGYRLAPFASEALALAGKVAAELGHRLTTHPGQVRRSLECTMNYKSYTYYTLYSLRNLDHPENKSLLRLFETWSITTNCCHC